MKITSILNFAEAYRELSTQSLPMKLAYKLNKLKQQVENDTQFYDSKFKEIVKKYAQKEEGQYKYSEDGQHILIQDDKLEECTKAFEDLNALECDGYEALLIPFEMIENLEMTPVSCDYLMPFIKEKD